MPDIAFIAQRVATEVLAATDAAHNETELRHNIENSLRLACVEIGIPWSSYQLDSFLGRATSGGSRFADAIHGSVVIEYEPPRSFRGNAGAVLDHARGQADEYTLLLRELEGRSRQDYVMVAWDGATISFGALSINGTVWEPPRPFNGAAALRLMEALRANGRPLVHAGLLSAMLGPHSVVGQQLIPAFFDGIRATSSGRTQLMYTEWRRLFAQAVGAESAALSSLLSELGTAHSRPYQVDPPAYLFALNTYIALVAKVVAALALPRVSENVLDGSVSVHDRMRALESGRVFVEAGIRNLLSGDLFSWYVDDDAWQLFESGLEQLLATLSTVSFDLSVKDASATRDLFKGLYMQFAPRALRHALGEYYTPDWLAEHAFDAADWDPADSMLDPTCGSGTFVLEALRRRLRAAEPSATAASLLAGLHGIDLNPLAVLSARASLVVYLADRIDPSDPLLVPIYLADAMNPAVAEDGLYHHSLLTELGERQFSLPADVVESPNFYDAMSDVRRLIEAEVGLSLTATRLASLSRSIDSAGLAAVESTVSAFIDLHNAGWNGVWTDILADRFAAGAINKVALLIGNPPWVKWSHLPDSYATFIKPRCIELGVFSDDSWVGGIESDISTVIAYESIGRYLDPAGTAALLLTGTVFANESSQGFRRWTLHQPEVPDSERDLKVILVEDYHAVAPFEGATNHPALIVLKRGAGPTVYPVPYRTWTPATGPTGTRLSRYDSAMDFTSLAMPDDQLAEPVPGTDAGPWLRGTKQELREWRSLFSATAPAYRARKGVTTDANGVFFVTVEASEGRTSRIRNDPGRGRRPLAQVHGVTVESEHLFPLLRGRGIAAFRATPDPSAVVLVPQRGMHGDPELPVAAPMTYSYLRRFRNILEARSSLRRFQRGKPWWSLWSTGAYTFAPYKVVWKEMSGKRFVAAYVGSGSVGGETKVVVPDHKVYFVPTDSEEEAAYLTGLLNSSTISRAINAYSSSLSLGGSVVEYIDIPEFDPSNLDHLALVDLAKSLNNRSTGPSVAEARAVDDFSRTVLRVTTN